MADKKYIALLKELKQRINEAQVKTVMAANSQMLLLYWQLGNIIIQNQEQKGWGANIINQLSEDLVKAYPKLKGFSPRNLLYMKQFAGAYSTDIISRFIEIEEELKTQDVISQQVVAKLLNVPNAKFLISQQGVAKLNNLNNDNKSIITSNTGDETDNLFLQSVLSRISWTHHVLLQNKVKNLGERLWYMLHAIEHGSSRNILSMHIESGLFKRQIKTKKINNFQHTLPGPQTDFANYLLKDPYIFDFVQAKETADERNIEEQLSTHITKFLLELGQGFEIEATGD